MGGKGPGEDKEQYVGGAKIVNSYQYTITVLQCTRYIHISVSDKTNRTFYYRY